MNLSFFAIPTLKKLAEQYGSPLYVYSRQVLEKNWREFDQACSNYPHHIYYAVKANSNLAVLNLLARLGSGFDIVSVGELERVIAAGGNPQKIIFSGVGKQPHEIERALKLNIECFNVESWEELALLNACAEKLNCFANISLRMNPNIAVTTHPYITTGLKDNKFGLDCSEALSFYQQANQLKHIKITGIACHIGSQINDIVPFTQALQKLLELVDALKALHIDIKHIDMGGGLGVCYSSQDKNMAVKNYAQALIALLEKHRIKLLLSPGRAIVASAGILLTRVLSLKKTAHKNFAIVDAGMNDFMRPALYGATHDIISLEKNSVPMECYDVVGPVCESSDFLAHDIHLALQANDLLAVTMTGAYGFSMSSSYNSRLRVAEVMVDGNTHYLIRARETMEQLMAGERCLPE